MIVTCECGKCLQVPPGAKAKKGKCPGCGRILNLAIDRPPGLWHLLPRRAGPIVSLAFEPSGQFLAAVHETAENGKGIAALWDAAKGQEIGIVRGQPDRLTAASFSPSGDELIVAGRDRGIVAWSVIRGMWDAAVIERRQALSGHNRAVTSVASATSTGLAATAGEDQWVRLWQSADWSCAAAWETDRAGSAALAFSPCGRLLAAAWRSRGPVILWETAKPQEAARLKLPREDDTEDLAVAFAARGQTLAVLSIGIVRTWDLSTHQVLLEIPAGDCTALGASPDGQTLALASGDALDRCSVRIHNTFTGEIVQTLSADAGRATSVAYAPQGDLIAAGCVDGSLAIWKLAE